jgi:hypothetical protein
MDNGVTEKMKKLKETVKQKGIFGYETMLGNANSILQGIPGRYCGYHDNKKLTIYANLGVCKAYFELVTKKITIQEYDLKIGRILKSKGRSTVAQATHIVKKSKIISEHYSIKPIVLCLPGKIENWREKDIYREIGKHKDWIKGVGEGYISDTLSGLIVNCLRDNKENLGKEGKDLQVKVGKEQAVTDIKGLLYYPNGKAISNNMVQKDTLLKEIQKAQEGNFRMESFTGRSKDNPNKDKINIGILFNDGDGKNEIVICLKDRLVEEAIVYDLKDTSMNKDSKVVYF